MVSFIKQVIKQTADYPEYWPIRRSFFTAFLSLANQTWNLTLHRLRQQIFTYFHHSMIIACTLGKVSLHKQRNYPYLLSPSLATRRQGVNTFICHDTRTNWQEKDNMAPIWEVLRNIISSLHERLPPCWYVWGCIQKFPDWPPGARTTNITAFWYQVQLCRYFVSQSFEFCRHNPLCCFSTCVCCCWFRYGLSPETFGYALVNQWAVPGTAPLCSLHCLYRTAMWEVRWNAMNLCYSQWSKRACTHL